jgi:Flp pilus assembly protein TadD
MFGQTPDRNPETLVSEGLSLMKSGAFDNAASKFREAIQLKLDLAAAHYDLALALLRSHRESEALPELQAVVALSPAFDAAHYNLAMLLEEGGQFR